MYFSKFVRIRNSPRICLSRKFRNLSGRVFESFFRVIIENLLFKSIGNSWLIGAAFNFSKFAEYMQSIIMD